MTWIITRREFAGDVGGPRETVVYPYAGATGSLDEAWGYLSAISVATIGKPPRIALASGSSFSCSGSGRSMLRLSWDGPPLHTLWRLKPMGPPEYRRLPGGDLEAVDHRPERRVPRYD